MKNFNTGTGIAILALFLCVCSGCGTTMKTLATDAKTADEIMEASDDRITRIMLNDSTSEFGTHVVIKPSTTEWKAALVVRREMNEINVFHASDAWKFTEGDAMHTAITTNMIKSITVPADRLGAGLVIGGAIGLGLGVALATAIGSTTSSISGVSSSLNTLIILEVVALAFSGAALGGQIGATHQTMYVR